VTPEQLVEDAARAICRIQEGSESENVPHRGRPLWEIYVPDATAALTPANARIAKLEAEVARKDAALQDGIRIFGRKAPRWADRARAALNQEAP
jgi:hypothetical protein